MRYYEAALQVLRSAERPLTAREITERAISEGLITPTGRTPHVTMNAKLYVRGKNDPELVKLQVPGQKGRAENGTVRWTLRHTAAVSPDRKPD